MPKGNTSNHPRGGGAPRQRSPLPPLADNEVHLAQALQTVIGPAMDGRPHHPAAVPASTIAMVLVLRRRGWTMDRIASVKGMPSASVISTWRARYPAFGEAMREAQAEGAEERLIEAEHVLEGVVLTAKGTARRRPDGGAVNAISSLIRHRAWMASKLLPRTYGDSLRVQADPVVIQALVIGKTGRQDASMEQAPERSTDAEEAAMRVSLPLERDLAHGDIEPGEATEPHVGGGGA